MKKDTFQKTIYILTLFYLVPLCVILSFNALISAVQTTYMDLYQEAEIPRYKGDHPILLVLITILILGLFVFFFISLSKKEAAHLHRIKKSAEICSISLAALICFSAILLFRCIVSCDSSLISDIAIQFMKGDYSAFSGDGYLRHYPFQIGMVGYLQIFYTLFGIECFLPLQFANAILILVSVFVFHRICDLLFADDLFGILFSVCSIAFLPLYLYAIFIYGDVPGICFGIYGIYFVMKYMKCHSKWSMLPAAICMSLSLILKGNSMILLIAVLIGLILYAISERDPFSILFCIVLILGYVLPNKVLYAAYAHAAGLQHLPDGIPKVAWIAMGLQPNDAVGYGAYNGYNWDLYTKMNYDSAASSAAAIANIRESLSGFAASPKYALKFFYYKFISMWNMPDCNAQLHAEWYSRHVEGHSALALSLIYGTGRSVLSVIMNYLQFMILVGASVFAGLSLMPSSRFQKGGCHLLTVPISLSVFGGYLFHMFWESQSRYALPYYVLCIPMAVLGWYEVILWVQKMIPKRRPAP